MPAQRSFRGTGRSASAPGLTKYRDVLVTVRDWVAKLKKSGRTENEVIASKPTADLDAVWGKRLLMPDQFVGIVYNTR